MAMTNTDYPSPYRCYVCGDAEHPNTAYHDFWSELEAETAHAAEARRFDQARADWGREEGDPYSDEGDPYYDAPARYVATYRPY